MKKIKGVKYDGEKPDWSLLPMCTVREIVKVLTFGARKYSRDNWQYVPDSRNRYYSALIRHMDAWQSGELIDPESGLLHLGHAGCCIVFLLWDDLKNKIKRRK